MVDEEAREREGSEAFHPWGSDEPGGQEVAETEEAGWHEPLDEGATISPPRSSEGEGQGG